MLDSHVTTYSRIRSFFFLIGLFSLQAGIAPGRLLFAQSSPHGSIKFACEDCHTADSWTIMPSPPKFKHDRTGFFLVGQHAVVACTRCHTTLKFAVTGRRCVDCHEDVHRGELGMSCDRCHTPQSWLVPDMVQRHNSTRFALLGAHQTANCKQCHTSQEKHEYVGVRTDCAGCHQADYNASKNPSHRSVGFGLDCASCHSVNALRWGGDFDHARTGFRLTGAHASVPCSQCHTSGNFTAASPVCYSCHAAQFTSATNPAHAGFSKECVTCHSTTSWRPASFDHSKTIFPLTGAHLAVTCTDCHKNNVYAGTATACYACHQTQFTIAANPPHAGFSTDCLTCHTTTAWQPATFDHSKTAFALTGAHLSAACASCHVNNVYKGTPTTCGASACHLQTFNTTNNPAHASVGFGTDCQSCHMTTGWKPSTWSATNHSFPITATARHKSSTWPGGCTDCHTSLSYAAFSCIDCHQHSNKSQVDSKHGGVKNYVYTSPGCLSCHPQGRAG